MEARNDARFSTCSGAPSIQSSLTPTLVGSGQLSEKDGDEYNHEKPVSSSSSSMSSNDPKTLEIKTFAKFLDKMNDERMDRQRYVMSGDKSEEVGKNALGAKLERALGRRMVGQDASFTNKKPIGEKHTLTVEAR